MYHVSSLGLLTHRKEQSSYENDHSQVIEILDKFPLAGSIVLHFEAGRVIAEDELRTNMSVPLTKLIGAGLYLPIS
jgi:hypothetical protein